MDCGTTRNCGCVELWKEIEVLVSGGRDCQIFKLLGNACILCNSIFRSSTLRTRWSKWWSNGERHLLTRLKLPPDISTTLLRLKEGMDPSQKIELLGCLHHLQSRVVSGGATGEFWQELAGEGEWIFVASLWFFKAQSF